MDTVFVMKDFQFLCCCDALSEVNDVEMGIAELITMP